MKSASPRPATNEPTDELPGQQASRFHTKKLNSGAAYSQRLLASLLTAAAGLTSPVAPGANARSSAETLYF